MEKDSYRAHSRCAARSVPEPSSKVLLELGRRVRAARTRRAMTRRALADASGLSMSYLARMEGDGCNISLLLLERVASALGVQVVDLLTPDSPQAIEIGLLVQLLERLPTAAVADLRAELSQRFGHAAAARSRRVALLGLHGVGKSTVGSRLAARLNVPFVELNSVIERQAGMSVGEVFLMYGQSGFRRYEQQALEHVIDRYAALVLATGGGLVAEPATHERLLGAFHTVWLYAKPEDYWARVTAQGDRRLTRRRAEVMANLKAILRERETLYRRSDTHVDTSGRSVDEVVEEALQRVASASRLTDDARRRQPPTRPMRTREQE